MRRGARSACRGAAAAAPKTVNDGYGDFVRVPAGRFTMGDTFGDGDPRERPAHAVELDAFYIGKYEVTNAQWRRFRDDPGYDDPTHWPDGRVMPKDQIPYWTQAKNHGGGTPDSDAYPVLGVNWDGAAAYCRWLSAKTGKTYRLPTEAEWEKAARGTDKRRYPWGNDIDRTRANFAGGQAFDTGRPVGFYDGIDARRAAAPQSNASPYGAFDMAGNVMEWVPGLVRPRLLRHLAAAEPQGARDRRLPGPRGRHVLHGPARFRAPTPATPAGRRSRPIA